MADMNKFVEQIKDFDINEIDWDRVGVWPLAARAFLFVVAFSLVVLGGYFFLIKDKNIQLEKKEKKELALRASFEEKAHEALNLEAYRKQMREMEQSFAAVVAQLPSEIEVPDLLEDIDSRVVDSRLEITSIDPQSPVSKEFYIELPINIKVVGGYHEFGSFVSGIAGMSRIVTLHDFRISTNQRGQNADSLTMDITAKTYKYKSQDN